MYSLPASKERSPFSIAWNEYSAVTTFVETVLLTGNMSLVLMGTGSPHEMLPLELRDSALCGDVTHVLRHPGELRDPRPQQPQRPPDQMPE